MISTNPLRMDKILFSLIHITKKWTLPIPNWRIIMDQFLAKKRINCNTAKPILNTFTQSL